MSCLEPMVSKSHYRRVDLNLTLQLGGVLLARNMWSECRYIYALKTKVMEATLKTVNDGSAL